MDWTSVAVADVRFALALASSAYQRFAEMTESSDARGLLLALGHERNEDGGRVAEAMTTSNLEAAEPLLDSGSAIELLGLGRSEPRSLSAMAYRVRRSENELARLVGQARTVVAHPVVAEALSTVETRIRERSADVADLRRLARQEDLLSGDYAAKYAARPKGTPEEEAEAEGLEETVWFGTNRAIDANGRFTSRRDQTLRYGSCRVYVPFNRAIGTLKPSWITRLINGADRVRFLNATLIQEQNFWGEIASRVGKLDAADRHGLVFLHGYCVTFEEAAERTCQLKVDLNYEGPMAFFSWPSLGRKWGYSGDAAAIDASEGAITDFLVDFARKSGATAVHIIAHSMGNRGLLRAMDKLSRDAAGRSGVQFGQIFLAAPDVDTDVFRNLAAAYGALANRTTMYVSQNDRVLGLSRFLHRFPRAGLVPPVVVVPSVDTVNVSKINLGLLGHSYAAEIRPVIGDIHDVIRNDTPPDRRFGLRSVGGAADPHWEFLP